MLYEKCQQVKVKRDEWLCRCPLCGDSKTKPFAQRFHINYYPKYDTFMYKCHRCGESNNVYMLYCELYSASYDDAKKFLNDTEYNPKQIKKRLKQQIVIDKEEVETELDIDLMNDCYRIEDDANTRVGKRLIERLKDFVKERNVHDEPFYIAHSGRYKSRIIIPIINHGILEYFQGRSLYDDVEPKYLNPVVEKEGILLHKDKFKSNESIIVTEGIIDGMTVGSQGTCCLGAYISDDFIAELMKYTNQHIIICLDNDDAGREQLFKIANNSSYTSILKFFLMPYEYNHIKDINELHTTHDISDINEFIKMNSFSDFYVKTKLKLLCQPLL